MGAVFGLGCGFVVLGFGVGGIFKYFNVLSQNRGNCFKECE